MVAKKQKQLLYFDLLIRGGIEVNTASITDNLTIHCSRGITLIANITLNNAVNTPFDIVILPGGEKGADNFCRSNAVIKKLTQTHQQGGIVAAICASPALVLQHHHLFPSAKMTGYPSTQSLFPIDIWVDARVYYSQKEKVLTSQGPGTTFDFALEIISLLQGKQKAAEVAKQLVLPEGINQYRE